MLGKLIPWKKRTTDVQAQEKLEHPALACFREEFDQLWDRFWNDLEQWDDARLLSSRIDIDDNEREYVLRAELPGFEPDDIDISVRGNMLTLRAEHAEEGQAEKGNGSYRRYGGLYESFTLPRGVLADQIDARCHSGVLEVHLPKSEEAQPKRIEVKST